MEIVYLGHSSFRIKGKKTIVVTDPFSENVGFKMCQVSADIITVSHQHKDHNNISAVTATAKREAPFIVDAPGEYEIAGVSVFGIASSHGRPGKGKRGENTIYMITIDGLRLVHLGDLGDKLTEKQLEEINGVDILLIPVGGTYTLDDNEAVKVIGQIEPLIVIPMHYKTAEMKPDFGIDLTIDDFLKTIGEEGIKPKDKLVISRDKLPQEREIVILKRKH